MPKGKRTAPTRGLACHGCGSTKIKVSESQQQRRVARRPRLHADVRCLDCRHRWWSRHKTAIAVSRAEDDAAAG